MSYEPKRDSQKQIRNVLKELRGSSSREQLLHRLHAVVLVLNGFSASHAARIYGDSPRAVAYWVNRFNKNGVAGLDDEPRPGRPSKLNASQLRSLQTLLRRSKKSTQSENAANASAYLLREHGISLTPRQCWRILKQLAT